MRFLSATLLTLGVFATAEIAGVSAASAPNVSCNSTTSCYLAENTSSGPAYHAEGNAGYGLRATSVTGGGLLGTTSSGFFMSPGVDGENTGVADSAGGAFGVNGFASPQSAPYYGAIALGGSDGLYGSIASAGLFPGPTAGVLGVDDEYNLSGVYRQGHGVTGYSNGGTGMLAESNAVPAEFVTGFEPIGLFAVAQGFDANHESVGIGTSSDGVALEASNTTYGSSVVLASSNMVVGGSMPNGSFYFDNYGNESLTGSVKTDLGTFVRTQGADGKRTMSYGVQSASPQMEDVGEGRLVNGRAYVPIDAALDNVIDQRIAYHVFLTPEGDSNGLYIEHKTPAGFTVREQHAGRSTLAFEYRIVAKPRGNEGRRLASAPAELTVTTQLKFKSPPGKPFVSAIDRIKARLGPAGYAKALAAFVKRESGR